MDSSGHIHRIKDKLQLEAVEEEHGELLELEEDAAKKLEELPKAVRQAFYQSMMEQRQGRTGKDRSGSRSPFNRAKAREKGRIARKARAKQKARRKK